MTWNRVKRGLVEVALWVTLPITIPLAALVGLSLGIAMSGHSPGRVLKGTVEALVDLLTCSESD